MGKRDTQTHKPTDIRTSRLLDRIGPVGRFDEKIEIYNVLAIVSNVLHIQIPNRVQFQTYCALNIKKIIDSECTIELAVNKLNC